MSCPNRHRVYVTRNTEYHLRDGLCVGVRDRQTGRWHEQHVALYQKLRGSLVRVGEEGARIRHGMPLAGDSLVFEGRVVTSPIVTHRLPSEMTLAGYVI